MILNAWILVSIAASILMVSCGDAKYRSNEYLSLSSNQAASGEQQVVSADVEQTVDDQQCAEATADTGTDVSVA